MKTTTFAGALALATMITGCVTEHHNVESAAGDVIPVATTTTVTTTTVPAVPTVVRVPMVPSDRNALSAYADAGMKLSERMRVLEARVAAIDRIPLFHESVALDADTFRDMPDAVWLQMEAWYDGSQVAKLYLFPPNDREDTEEFYFDQGRLVYVYWNPVGFTGGSQPGESFYFGQEGLIAWMRDDGTRGDPMSAEFRHWDKQLRRLASRLSETSHR